MSMDSRINHFISVHRADVINLYEGLAANQAGAVDRVLDKVRNSQLVADFATAVSTSQAQLKAFTDRLQALGPLGRIVAGLTEVAAGAVMWQGAAALGTGVLAFLGTELIVVIALALLAIGVMTAFRGVSDLIKSRLEERALDLG